MLSCGPCHRAEEGDGSQTLLGGFCAALNSLLVAFLFCWFVTGNVWIFSVYPPNYDDTIPQEPYCDRNLYLFALWSTVAMYVLLGVLLLACICLSVCIWICGKKEPIRGFTWNV
ncbi:transmembrane protein 272-like [Scleropages formosus]|uniref:transmembrane protein 272-like n=1 Tax=Scleropages formosus TaxID=113540 RepID=UPI0010FA6E51|nr:transmembrane protein 272-like [Scleropages formosus]